MGYVLQFIPSRGLSCPTKYYCCSSFYSITNTSPCTHAYIFDPDPGPARYVPVAALLPTGVYSFLCHGRTYIYISYGIIFTPPKDTACRFFIISRSCLPQTVNGKRLSGTSARPGGADHSAPILVRGEGGAKTCGSHGTAASHLRCDAPAPGSACGSRFDDENQKLNQNA